MLDSHQMHGLEVLVANASILLALAGWRRFRKRQRTKPIDMGSPEDALRELVLHPWEWRVVEQGKPGHGGGKVLKRRDAR